MPSADRAYILRAHPRLTRAPPPRAQQGAVERAGDDGFSEAFARIENHYFINKARAPGSAGGAIARSLGERRAHGPRLAGVL